MTAEAKSCRKKWKIAVSILLAVLILLAGARAKYLRTPDLREAFTGALPVFFGKAGPSARGGCRCN